MGGRVYAQFGIQSGVELAVIQFGLSVRELDKVLGHWFLGKVVLVILSG